jgi:hypothetical protein
MLHIPIAFGYQNESRMRKIMFGPVCEAVVIYVLCRKEYHGPLGKLGFWIHGT